MIVSEFNTLMREHIDFTDRDSLHAVSVALEADQTQLLVALTGKLYDKIQDKADKIDFKSIARSRGDITKIENYNSLMECIDIIKNIVVGYNQNTAPVDTVITAVENIKSRDVMFKKAFAVDANLPMMVYNTITLAIVSAVSFLIDVCIEYVKYPGQESFQMALDTVAYSKTKDNLLFESLNSFNKACSTRELDETFDVIMKVNRVKTESAEVDIEHDTPFLSDEDLEKKTVIHDEKEELQTEGVIVSTISRVFIFVTKVLIAIIRTIVYYFYNCRQKISDYYSSQADLLEANAYALQYNSAVNDQEKKKIFDKQMKTADKWRKRANRTSVDYSVAKKNAGNDIKKDETKYTVSSLDINPNEESEAYLKSSIF